MEAAIRRVVDGGQFILGEEVEAFEGEFASYLGCSHAIGVGNGTEALYIALRALGIGPGDEVITVPFTYIATTEAISLTGARFVFADVNPETYTLDPDGLEDRLTPRTKAILAVHLFGHPADVGALSALAKEHRLRLVEDAAQAHGARYQGCAVGTLGDVGAFSFYPGKNLGALGDAGAMVTDDSDLADRARLLRNHGRKSRYEHILEGTNSRLDALQAALLRVKLPRLNDWNERRRLLASRYQRRLSGLSGLICPPEPAPGVEPVHHQFVIQVTGRDALKARLKLAQIETAVHYARPLHLQPAYAGLGFRQGDFPVSETLSERVLSLPIYPELTEQDQDRICDVIESHLTASPVALSPL